MSAPSAFVDIAARCGGQRWKALPAKVLRRLDLGSAARAQPSQVVRPPRVPGGLVLGDPVLGRAVVVDRAGAIARLRVAGWVDQCGNVTAGGQHVGGVLAAEQTGAAVGGLPRADVVGDTAD